MRSLIISSAASGSARLTTSRRFSGSSVVSYSVFGFISPRPLNRVISVSPSVGGASRCGRGPRHPAPNEALCRHGSDRAAAGEVHMAVFDQRVGIVEEGEQVSRQVPIAIGIHQQDDPRIAEPSSRMSARPTPNAVTTLDNSSFFRTFFSVACSALGPSRRGRIAWVLRSRACLAEPPHCHPPRGTTHIRRGPCWSNRPVCLAD